MKILILNGPNLNMLGKRDVKLYGDLSLEKIEKLLTKEFENFSFTFFQSNSEGDLVDKIQDAGNNFDGIIINPGGYAHTSVAIHDALEECTIPKIEVHLSHLAKREEFRQNLITASGCDGYISGFKEHSYLAGIYLLQKLINK
ncbi:MAG: type II 3-dehydroquinate dehydratase [Ignavibacteriaceae bacterium]